MHKNHYLKEKDTETGAEKHNTFLTGVFFYYYYYYYYYY